MAILDLNYSDIQQTEEYQNDVSLLTSILMNAVGNEKIAREAYVFIWIITSLAATQRYFVRHMPDLVDIDTSPFLNLIQAETGLNLPLTSDIPLVEFLRESKSWAEHKGSIAIYDFIGDLVGSPIEVDFPKDLIFKVGKLRTCVGGASGGPYSFAQSKMGRIRDGILWAQFTYIVNVLQAQDITSIDDLFNLLNSVDPAHCQMFVKLAFNFSTQTVVPTVQSRDFIKDHYVIRNQWPTVGNQWLVGGSARVSMRNGNALLMITNINEIPLLQTDSTFRRMSDDTIMHDYITSVGPWAGFSRYISVNGDYQQVFSDTDAIVLENVSTNVGISQYEWQDLATLTWQELQDAAWNLDQANMRGTYMPNQLDVEITTS
jgi:hypothetical protein